MTFLARAAAVVTAVLALLGVALLVLPGPGLLVLVLAVGAGLAAALLQVAARRGAGHSIR